ncbi:MAG: hypothetical protein FWE67_13215, partial [Planctomycetaceae bacterium]|nr:hypothetical protein [Planctomycetaceae bacterium]
STNDWLDFETWSEAKANFRALVALSFNGKVGTNTGAMSLADYKIFSERWEREMIPLLLVLLKEFHSFQQKRAILYNDAIDSEETKEILDFFFDICKKHNVQAYREYDTPKQFEEFEADMRAKFIPAPPPEFCKDLPKTSWLEVQNAEFRSWSFGKTIFTVTDEKASNKRAVKMLDNPQRREVCYDFDNSLQDLTPIGEAKDIPQYRVYAAVRCDAKEGIEGKAMNVGVYDGKNNKSVTLKTPAVAEIRGLEYRWIDLGVHPLQQRQYFHASPPQRPAGEIDAAYVDRIVVIREQ